MSLNIANYNSQNLSSPKKRRNNKLIDILGSIAILIGYYIFALPTLFDLFSRVNQNVTISEYENRIDNMSYNKIQEALEDCYKYNNGIAEYQTTHRFVYGGSDTTDEMYEKLPIEDSSEIGTIIIPEINVNLPIGKGTSDEVLRHMAGHIYGTSLPVGGENTHSVIAAHTALQDAELFSRVDELKIGDKFYISVLGKNLEYEVDQIEVVVPEDADKYLQIIPGEDYVTLYTCTPYGINTHRLLVRGKRTEENIKNESLLKETGIIKKSFNTTKNLFILICLLIFPIIIVILLNRKK